MKQGLFFVLLFLISGKLLAQKPVLVIPKGHTETVTDALIFGKNQYVLSGGRDNSIKIWDLRSQKEIASFAGEKGRGAYSFVGITPDEEYVMRGGSKELTIWKTKTKALYQNVLLEDGFVKDIVVTPDSKKVYFRSDAGSKSALMCYELATQKLTKIKTIDAARFQTFCYDKTVRFVVYSPFAKNYKKNEIVRIDLQTGKTETLISTTDVVMEGMGLIENGTKGLFWDYAGNTTVFDTESGRELTHFQVGSHERMVFSPNGRNFVTRQTFGGNKLEVYDVLSKRARVSQAKGHDKVYANGSENIIGIRFSEDGELVVSTGEDKQVLVWAVATGELVFSSKAKASEFGLPLAALFSPNQQQLYLDDARKRVVTWDLNKGMPTVQFKDISSTNLQAHFDLSTDGRQLIAIDSSGRLGLYETAVGKKTKLTAIAVSKVIWLTAEKALVVLAASANDRYALVDLSRQRVLQELAETSNARADFFAISPAKDRIALATESQAPIRILSLNGGTSLTIPADEGYLEALVFSADGSRLCVAYSHKTKRNVSYLITYDLATGRKLKSNDISVSDTDTKLCVSPNGNYLLAVTGDSNAEVLVYDFATLQPLRSLKGHTNRIHSLAFAPNSQLVVSTSADYSCKLWNIETGKELATLVTFPKTNDWAVMSSDGRFDASINAQSKMYFVKGMDILPLSSLFENFYTPNLLARILAGEKLTPPAVDVNTLKKAPRVQIKVEAEPQRNLTVEDELRTYISRKAQVNITVEADSEEEVIAEIRLFQNGKLVGTNRNLTVEDDAQTGRRLTKVFNIMLLEGENQLKAVAINSQRTESKPDEIRLIYQLATPQPTSTTNLHLLVVGINNYKNPRYNLNYALADATGFKEAMERGGNGMFGTINTTYINDANASKEAIVAALEKIKMMATPKDVFLFYFAGHGVLSDKKEFYLVPYDVTQLYGNDGALSQKGLSSELMQQYSKEIKAQKQLFILDACQSAGALEHITAARGAAEEKAIAQLARSTGTHWLTASGSEQFASEFKELGHGTFTYVLLEAMKGNADEGGDNKITVKELDVYLQEKVPDLTEKYRGTPQYPASYSYGNDFPIVLVR